MSESADEVLERELGKLSRQSSGGGLYGAAGAAGARWAAHRLSSSSAEATIDISMNPRDALSLVFGTLSAIGQILTENVDDERPTLRAVIGSGFFGLNPAVVEVSLDTISDEITKVNVRATAKEGLIKQRTAEKAIQRLIDAAGWSKT
jgi:hypothetical protein